MKEATGELNMTVITIVAIAALVAFFYLIIWPALQSGMTLNSACNNSNAGQNAYTQTFDDGSSVNCAANSGRCTYRRANGRETTQQCED